MNRFAILFLLSLLAFLVAMPATASEYRLADGKISFDVPASWPSIMHKTSGDPQFYAFHVPNPDDPATLPRITVTTHRMQAVTDFDAYVKEVTDKARHSMGFSNAGNDVIGKHGLHYFFDQGEQRQVVHLSMFQYGLYAIILRCQRPRDAKASKQWLQAWEAGCEQLARQLDS